MRVTVFGYISRDINVLPNGEISQGTGGKGLYIAASLARCGLEVDLITWMPPSDAELLKTLAEYPVDIHVIPTEHGTVNRNVYEPDGVNASTQLDPIIITPAALNDGMRSAIEASDRIVIAPSHGQQLALPLLAYLANATGGVVGDLGNYFRNREPNGRLVSRWPWPEQAQYLHHLTSVFMSSEDVRLPLANGESHLSLARLLADQGPAEVIITDGPRGSFIFQAESNEGFDIPAWAPRQLIDPTGAGDTYLGAYLAEQVRTENALRAGKFAAMAATLKLNYTGPLRETAEEIDRALAERETQSP